MSKKRIVLKGNAAVESALVFPLVIVTVITLLLTGAKISMKIKESTENNRRYSISVIDPKVSAESVLRIKWLGSKVFQEE